MKKYVLQHCRKPRFCQNLLGFLNFKVGPWFCHSIVQLSSFSGPASCDIFLLFPVEEFPLSYSPVNLAVNRTSFCPDRNKNLCLLLFFLQLILRFSVHSVFHYFSSERTRKFPNISVFSWQKAHFLLYFILAPHQTILEKEFYSALYANRLEMVSHLKNQQWVFLRQIPTEKQELPE